MGALSDFIFAKMMSYARRMALMNTLTFLGMTDPLMLARLDAFDDLRDAWDRAADAGDLAWIATRVAPRPYEQALAAAGILHVVNHISPRARPDAHEALQHAILICAELVERGNDKITAGHVAEAANNIIFYMQEARPAMEAMAVTLKVRKTVLPPFPEHAIVNGMDAARLVLVGGWRSRAAVTASATVREVHALAPDIDLATVLRDVVPFKRFQTSLWAARATGD